MRIIISAILVTCSFAAAEIAAVGDEAVPQETVSHQRTIPCRQDPARLDERSKELSEIVREDQADREGFGPKDTTKTQEDFDRLIARDEIRRKRVGEIFGEGCFAKASDYAAAALVFQHGNTPDHFYQAFTWFKKAYEMGDKSQREWMAKSIDRYLSSTGHKPLFGGGFSKTAKPNGSFACSCLEPVEETFPDSLRREYGRKTQKENLELLKEYNAGHNCSNRECDVKLKPTPKGSAPGIW